MVNLGVIDLEILYLEIRGNESFNEKDIENSGLKKLGVGRTLDSLASLKERNLIDLNRGGLFSVTNLAKHILWTEEIPIWLKILRLLQIKSCNSGEISKYLKKSEIDLIDEIEKLRSQWVLMLPIKQVNRIIKTYKILPEGIEKIKRVDGETYEISNLEKINDSKIEILELLNQIIKEISQEHDDGKKNYGLILKLNQIKEKL
ncbi:MAG: hypothetical protein JHC41_01845 [Nitrosopumilus sp.]|jgi:hypothetical protein|nr:hypothetical protein [Nitrosopumilus sp.]